MTEQASGLLGSSGMIPSTGIWLHNQRIGRVRTRDDDSADPRFIYYLFNTPAVRAQISATATGAKVRHTAPERILAVRARVPDRPQQQHIAAVLAAFDDLIEINERRIELLEDLARSLYREWFVRFGFPGHSADAAPPSDWQDHRLGDIATAVTDGVDPAAVALDMPYCGLEHFPRRATTLREWGSIESVTSRKLRFREGDTLFGKIRPYFHKVVWSPFDGVASSDTIVFRAKGSVPIPALIATMLSSDEVVAAAVATSNGTKMPRADPQAILKHVVGLPPLDGELAKRAEDALRATYDLAASLVRTNRALARTRDLLLPRLVTGRLDISDVDLGNLLPEESAA